MNNTNPLYLIETAYVHKLAKANALQRVLTGNIKRPAAVKNQLLKGKENSRKISELIKTGMDPIEAKKEVVGRNVATWRVNPTATTNNFEKQSAEKFATQVKRNGVVHSPKTSTIDEIIKGNVSGGIGEGDRLGHLKFLKARNASNVQKRIAAGQGYFSAPRRKLRKFERLAKRYNDQILPANVFD